MRGNIMRLAYIVDNYGRTCDGVGVYAEKIVQNLPSWIETTVYSAKCPMDSKLKKVSTLGMTRAIFRAYRKAKGNYFDAYLLEYPFAEWQPLILLPIWLLSRSVRGKQKLILSLHEYLRGSKLRRLVARQICKLSDVILITDESMRESIKAFAKEIYLRPIPSNVYDEQIIADTYQRNPRQFTFFGIVNPKTKAFAEMLEAWDRFNANGEYQLCLLSITDLDGIEKKHRNVTYIHDADDLQVLENLKRSTFCLLPIKPMVDMRSGTLKTASITGCICIGKFSEEFQTLPFVIPMEDYQISDFEDALNRAIALNTSEIQRMSHEAEEWGKKYTPAATARLIADVVSYTFDCHT